MNKLHSIWAQKNLLTAMIPPLICVVLVGCFSGKLAEPTSEPVDESIPLKELVAQTLDQNARQRGLSVDVHGAWQVLHGILAYGDAFQVRTPEGNVSAVDYLREGGLLPGFRPAAGHKFGDRVGLKVRIEPREKVGQGHRDQWLAVLAQTGLGQDATIKSGSQVFTMRDWVNQAQWDTPPSFLEAEYSWTLIALAAYNDTQQRWQASDGNTYNIESLLKVEIDQNLVDSACGGTHRLIGIATALNKRKEEGAALTETWLAAQELVDQNIVLAKQNQNPDGSYSPMYMHRQGWTRDLGETLGTTGHVLEFLAIAADDETIKQPWVDRSVRRLCQVLQQCEGIDLECGALYHALHGLAEYYERIK